MKRSYKKSPNWFVKSFVLLVLTNVVLIGMINIFGMGNYILQVYLILITLSIPRIVTRMVKKRRVKKEVRADLDKRMQARELCEWALDLIKLHRFDEALHVLTEAVNVYEKYPYANEIMAKVYATKDYDDNCIACYKEALSVDGNRPKSLMGLGLAYQRRGLHILAKKEYEKASEITKITNDKETRVDLLMAMSWNSIELCDFNSARGELREAAKLSSYDKSLQEVIEGMLEELPVMERWVNSWCGLLN